MDGSSSQDTAFLPLRTAMAREIAARDWSDTPLGPIADWPAVLKVTVSTMVSSSFPKCLCWGPDLIALYNDAFIPILGEKHPCLGRPFLEIWQEAAETIAPIAHKALSGEPTFIEDFRLLINRTGTEEEAAFTFCYSPVYDEFGTVCGMLDTVVETTGKVKAEAASKIRNRELVHRSRNAYTLVSSMINQTFRNATSLDETKEKLQQRIRALVQAQDILSDAGEAKPSILSAIRLVLDPFIDGAGQIDLDGEDLDLGKEQATALSLALHELATNATKYGALSTAEGRVTLRWDERGGAEAPFRLTWIETGGPAVAMPASVGFGSRIITGVLPDAFHGSVDATYRPEGYSMSLAGRLD